MNDLKKLFLSELKDIYDGEQQILKALPKMEEKASSQTLKLAFQTHRQQTEKHVRRLESVFYEIGEEAKRKTCKGLSGVIDDGELLIQEFSKNSALDAALIAAAQKVEHYEVSTYGTLCSWAKELGYEQVLSSLKENLGEEKQTDEDLTRLAEEILNPEAKFHDTKQKSQMASKVGKMVGL